MPGESWRHVQPEALNCAPLAQRGFRRFAAEMKIPREVLDQALAREFESLAARHTLRQATRFLRDELAQYLYAYLGLRMPEAHRRANQLMQLLLELNAVDLFGVAYLLRFDDNRKTMAERRRFAGKKLRRPPTVKALPAPRKRR
jgi:hypothetical protein